MDNKKMAIMIVSFDGYSDLWENFFFLFDKYWNENEFPMYLVSNYKTYKYKNLNNIQTGKEVSWINRVYKAIQSINEEYILLMLEDYFLGDFVQNELIEEVMNFIINNDVKYYRLIDIPKSVGAYKKDYIGNILENQNYGINLQCAIWKKEFLLELLDSMPNANSAWEFETTLVSRCKNSNARKIVGAYSDRRDILSLKNGVIKGKWVRRTIRYYKKRNILLNLGNRKKMGIVETLRHDISGKIINSFSNKSVRIIKDIMKRLGFKFLTD